MITIALPKGRIFTETIPILKSAGIVCSENPESSRKLVFKTNDKNIQLIIVRASDVPTYVECGGADMGIAGKDVLDEYQGMDIYQPLDLKIGKCKMMVACKKDFDYMGAMKNKIRLKVATKYFNVTSDFFAKKGSHIDLIKLYGSMELAPIVGLADIIVDLVSTGKTLEANNLIPVEQVSDITSRLIINKASLKLNNELLKPMIQKFSVAVN
jgi:ATP phosphoribosyltransferase